MKKLLLLLFLFNSITYSIPIEEVKDSYEYLLGEAIWSLILKSPFFFIITLFIYYIIFYFSLNKKDYSYFLYIDIFKNNLENKKELLREVIVKIVKIVILFFIWIYNILTIKIINIFPLFSILIFIVSIRPFFMITFSCYNKKNLEKFLFTFFLIIFVLSLCTNNNMIYELF